jgi:hypothetical protein
MLVVAIALVGTPFYMRIPAIVTWILVISALPFAGFACYGALAAAEKIAEQEAFSYLGIALFFLLPAAVLFFVGVEIRPKSPWMGLTQVAVLTLGVSGGSMGAYGLSRFIDPSEKRRSKPRTKKGTIKAIYAGLIGLISFGAAALGLISAALDITKK